MTTETKEVRVRIIADPDPINPRKESDNLGVMVCWHRRYNLGDEQPRESADEWLTALAVEACPRLGDIIDNWDNAGFEWLYEKYEGNLQTTLQVIADHTDSLVAAVIGKHYVILPLYLYDHSGITMNTGGFSCPWDSGQVGYIVCNLQTARENWMLPESADWDTPVKSWHLTEEGPVPITLREATEHSLRSEVEVYDQYLRGDIYGFVVEERHHCDKCDHEEWEHVDSCWGFFGSDPEENGMVDHLGDEKLIQLAKAAEVEY